nr:iron ABC transporter permease [Entomospira entomophilus]
MILLLLVGLMILSLFIGRYPLSVGDIIAILTFQHPSEIKSHLFFQVRLPRILMALLCGAYLAQAGSIYQTAFKNPLVSPDLLGVSSGATIGAIIGIVLLQTSPFSVQVMTFSFGLLAVLLAIMLANSFRIQEDIALVLAGIVISAILNSIIMMLKTIADPHRELALIEFWLMGSLQRSSIEQLGMMVLGVIPLLVLFLMRYQVKLLALGYEQARTLGLYYKHVKVTVILCATLLASITIMHVGVVAWVGLISPHISRLLFGDDYEKNFGSITIIGGIILLAADNMARAMFSVEIPISIITALMGATFLLIILWSRKRYD